MIGNQPLTAECQTALYVLNELRAAALNALAQNYKFPGLLLLYSLIDICASLSAEAEAESMNNRERFEAYVSQWPSLVSQSFSAYDLWASRSALIHTYSPLGHHHDKIEGPTPIFYYGYPETKEDVLERIKSRGYSEFHLVNIDSIKWLAIDGFNTLWKRVESELGFRNTFTQNAKHIAKDLVFLQVENILKTLE